MPAKKGKSWSEMSGGERKAVLVGWAAIAAISMWLVLPNSEDEPVASAPAAHAEEPVAIYQTASPEALTAAKQLMSDLDQALQEGLPLLKEGDLRVLGAHSQHFDSLVESAYASFGSTIFEPLGSCGVASNFARSGWKAQANNAVSDGTESQPRAAQEALEQFQTRRAECLEVVNPVGGTENHG